MKARLVFHNRNGGARIDTSRLCCDQRCQQGRDCSLDRRDPITEPTHAGWWIAAGLLISAGGFLVLVSCRAGCW